MKNPRTRREHEIWTICDKMLEEGSSSQKITGEAIRDRLFAEGLSKGSPNEIYKYRKSWRETRGFIDESNLFQTSSENHLSDPLTRAVEALRQEIRNESNLEIEQIQKDSEQKVQVFQKKVEDLEQELVKTNEKYQNFEKSSENLEHKIEQLKQERKAQLFEIKELELKLAASLTELKQITQQWTVAKKLNEENQRELQNKREHITKLEERNRQLQALITEQYFNK